MIINLVRLTDFRKGEMNRFVRDWQLLRVFSSYCHFQRLCWQFLRHIAFSRYTFLSLGWFDLRRPNCTLPMWVKSLFSLPKSVNSINFLLKLQDLMLPFVVWPLHKQLELFFLRNFIGPCRTFLVLGDVVVKILYQFRFWFSQLERLFLRRRRLQILRILFLEGPW